MESAVIPYSRLREKNKWVYSAHSQLSLQIEEHLNSTQFDVVTLGTLVKEIADSLHGVRHYVNDGVVMLAVGNVTEYGLDLSDRKLVTQEEHKRLKRSQVQRGDLLVTITGRLGSTLVYESDEPANLSAHVARVKVDDEAVNPYYLTAYLNSKVGKQLIDEFSIGSIYPHINVNRLKNVRVIIPPRSLQDQIAQVMQKAYSDRQKKLEEARNLLSSSSRVVLEELDLEISELKDEKYFTVSISKMTGGRFDLDLYNTRYTGLIALLQKKFDFTLTPLKSISHQITSGATPLGSKYFETGIPFLRVQNLNDAGEINFDDCLFVSEDFAKTLKRATIQNGDILLVIVGATIGKSAVVKDIEPPLVTNQALARIRIRETVDLLPDFLQAFLSSPAGQIQISALKRPVAQGNLSLTETGQVLVPMVPLDQQEKVISRIHAYRSKAKRLRNEAEAVVASAKARVERMILGEETVE